MQRLSQLLQISILAPPPSMTSFATMPHVSIILESLNLGNNISEHSESSDDDDDDAVELNELPLVENRRLALACDDGYVRLYTIPDTNELTYHKSLPRVSGRDLSVTWSADGNSFIQEVVMGMLFHHAKRICNWSEDVAMLCGVLVSADSTGSVQFWDIKHGTLLQAHSLHKGDSYALVAAPLHDRVFSAGFDGK
ncbi:hypothetical protein SOVF_123390, partial [Spinacia oleracea]